MTVKYPKNILQSFLLLLVGLIGTLPLVVLKETGLVNFPEKLYQPLIFLMLFIGTTLFYFIKNKYNFSLRELCRIKNKLQFKTWFLLLALLIVFQLGVNIPLSKLISFYKSSANNISNPLNNLGITLGAIVLAPICEEFIFRGMILNGLLNNYRAEKAIVFSSIIFCLAHVQPNLLPGAFILGMLLGYLFYVTKSVLPSMLLHALANFVTLFAGYYLYLLNGEGRLETIYGYATLPITIVSCLVSTTIVLTIYTRIKQRS